MTTKDLLNRIFSDITKTESLKELKTKKSSSWIYTQNDDSVIYSELDHWYNYDNTVTIRPIYGVRFSILHRWFEKFSVKPLKIQRSSPSEMFSGDMLGYQNEFEFSLDGENYDEVFKQLSNTLTNVFNYLMHSFTNLKQCYNQIIPPVLKDPDLLPDASADWIFIYLTLCKLVAPERYEEFKDIVLKRVKWMYGRKEPNVERYYDRLDEILSYMETPGNIK